MTILYISLYYMFIHASTMETYRLFGYIVSNHGVGSIFLSSMDSIGFLRPIFLTLMEYIESLNREIPKLYSCESCECHIHIYIYIHIYKCIYIYIYVYIFTKSPLYFMYRQSRGHWRKIGRGSAAIATSYQLRCTWSRAVDGNAILVNSGTWTCLDAKHILTYINIY